MFVLELLPNCQAQRGYSQGLSLPTVVFNCVVNIQEGVNVNAILPILEQHFGLTAPVENPELKAPNETAAMPINTAKPLNNAWARNNTSLLWTNKTAHANAELMLTLACQLAFKFLHKASLPLPKTYKLIAEQNRWRLFMPYIRHEASILALSMAVDALNAAASLSIRSTHKNASYTGASAQLALQLDRIQRSIALRLAPYKEPGQNRRYLIQAAIDNAIPYVRNGASYMTFGYGQFARRMASTYTDSISPIGAAIAKDKVQSAQVLRQFGLPGANNRLVRSKAHLLELAKNLGYPLVIKPADLDQGIVAYGSWPSYYHRHFTYQYA